MHVERRTLLIFTSNVVNSYTAKDACGKLYNWCGIFSVLVQLSLLLESQNYDI